MFPYSTPLHLPFAPLDAARVKNIFKDTLGVLNSPNNGILIGMTKDPEIRRSGSSVRDHQISQARMVAEAGDPPVKCLHIPDMISDLL